jgi:hypothetical protein
MSHNQQTTPLTLSIINPQTISIIPEIGLQKTTIDRISIPEFNHVPSNQNNNFINPTYHNPNDCAYIERHKYLNRERQRKFKEKRQGFTDLIKIDNINERHKQVWLLTYPDTYNHINSENLDIIIGQCVNSILASMKH